MDQDSDILVLGEKYSAPDEVILNFSVCGLPIREKSILKDNTNGKFSKWISMFTTRSSNWTSKNISYEPSLFSRLPCEMRHKIIQEIPTSEYFKLRTLSYSWQSDMQSLLNASVDLTSTKLKKFNRSLAKDLLTVSVNNYNIINLKHHFKRKHFMRLPVPTTVTINTPISSKNFLKLTKVWPYIEKLNFGVRGLCNRSLVSKMSPKYNGDVFPKLKSLGVYMDASDLRLGEALNQRIIRMNLNYILRNPHLNLKVISYQIFNFKNESMCYHMEPILKLISSCYKTIRDITISFENGNGSDFDPLRIAQVHKHSVNSLIRFNAENLLENLKQLRLTSCELHVPSLSGCPLSICNELQTIVETQSVMSRFVLENQIGISFPFLQRIVTHNQSWLIHLDVSVPLSHLNPFNLKMFSSCKHLQSLRLKRCFIYEDNFTRNPALVGFEFLPTTLRKLSLVQFEFTIRQLSLGISRTPNLEALILDRWSYPLHGIYRQYNAIPFFQRHLISAIIGSATLKLRLVSICFLQELLTRALLAHLGRTNSLELHPLLQMKSWKFDKVYRTIAYAPTSQILFYRNKEDCNIQWFTPFLYQKMRI